MKSSFDESLVTNTIYSVRGEVYHGNMSARDGFSVVMAVVRYFVDPKSSCCKDHCVLLELMGMINSAEYLVLTDERYDADADWNVGSKSLWNLHELIPAPCGLERGAMLVVSLDMVKEPNSGGRRLGSQSQPLTDGDLCETQKFDYAVCKMVYELEEKNMSDMSEEESCEAESLQDAEMNMTDDYDENEMYNKMMEDIESGNDDFSDIFEAKVIKEDYDELSNNIDDKVMEDVNEEIQKMWM